MDLNNLVTMIFGSEETLFLTGLIVFGVVAVIAGSVKGAVVGVARERTRREVAAYVAEGSMTPEQGDRLLRAGVRRGTCE